MIRKNVISFVFGSTALATSMSFFPLADANAGVCAPDQFSIEVFDRGSQSSVNKVGLMPLDVKDSLKGIHVIDTRGEEASSNSLEVSMIAAGYEDSFEDLSDSEESPRFALTKDAQHMARSNPDETVGIYTTADATDVARYAEAAYAFANPDQDKDIQQFLADGSTVRWLKNLKEEVTWSETTFQNQDTGIFVEKADGTAVLSFKGSDRLNTWFSDAYLIMMNHEDGGRYHGGFLTMYKELEETTWTYINEFAKKNGYTIQEAMDNITITGHSRGAGCAQVFADIARRKTGVAPKAITFAAPRALHKQTAALYNEVAKDKHLNILQAKDIVGHIALGSLNGGAHVGHKLKLPVDKGLWMHQMSGYRKPLNTLHVLGEVKRERDAKTGNTYRFVSANADEKRDLLKEADNSAQAWVETGIYAVKNPKEAATTLFERAKWAVKNPVEATEWAAETVIQGAKNVAEVVENTFEIGKLALVGTVKKIDSFVKDPETKATAKKVVSAIADAAESAADTVSSYAKKAWNAVKFW